MNRPAWRRSFSPRAGIRGFDTFMHAVATRRFVVASFSPRAGIRGFDTRRGDQTDAVRLVRQVSVPERGFVALIQRHSPEDGCSAMICTVSVPERGFVALIHVSRYADMVLRMTNLRFSPRAGIRGFDTQLPEHVRRLRESGATLTVSVPERGFVALILFMAVATWCTCL